MIEVLGPTLFVASLFAMALMIMYLGSR